MEKLKKLRWDMITTSVICVILGGVLIFFPKAVNEMIAYIIAGAMFVVSVIEFYNYFRKNVGNDFYRNDLVYAVVSLVIAIILLAKREIIISLIPIALGALIIISGVRKLQNGLDLIRLKLSGWKTLAVLATINIVFGIVMVICATEAAEFITVLIGIGLVYSGVSDIFSVIRISKIVSDKLGTEQDDQDLVTIDDTKE